MTKKIVQKENPVLRQVVKEVSLKDIRSEKIRQLIKDMSAALRNTSNGVGLAAPQIGVSLAVFLVSEEAVAGSQFAPEDRKKKKDWKHFVFINPKQIKASRKKEYMTEGCLSVEGIFGNIKRSKQVTVEAYNENGERFTVGASGLYAQVLQHELDHLRGVLFIDNAEDLEKMEINE